MREISTIHPLQLKYVTMLAFPKGRALETGTGPRHLLAAEDHEEVGCNEVQGPGYSVVVSLVACRVGSLIYDVQMMARTCYGYGYARLLLYVVAGSWWFSCPF